MATNPFGNLGLSYMGAEQGTGEKIGEAVKSIAAAYFLNASGLQGFMDKKKTDVGVPGAAVPGAAIGAVPAVAAPMGAMVPPEATAFPVNNPNIFTRPLPPLGTTLPPLVTDNEALDVLLSGQIKK